MINNVIFSVDYDMNHTMGKYHDYLSCTLQPHASYRLLLKCPWIIQLDRFSQIFFSRPDDKITNG